jgi:inhibitor of KinA sporulation pathway (predicted exonuclease)
MILMWEQPLVTDPEIAAFCRSIVKSQQTEIAQMQAIMQRYLRKLRSPRPATPRKPARC